MTMGIPCPHGDVKCLLGDRMATTSPSVVMDIFLNLVVKLVASSKQTLHLSMYASTSQHTFFSRGARLLYLSRAPCARGLGDGACVWVATVHNTSPSPLALISS